MCADQSILIIESLKEFLLYNRLLCLSRVLPARNRWNSRWPERIWSKFQNTNACSITIAATLLMGQV